VTNANAPAVAKICVRLDGLPLAIELAAARIKLLPPQALLSRLEHRLQVLTGGAQDAPRRQQTLRNTIEWSYELLDAHGQRLFRRLSVFVGGCDLEAVEAVCTALDGGAEAVLDSVSTLLDESLLQHIEQEDGGTRLLMLETIREYGLEMLAAAEEEEIIRQAHAHYYLSLAERAESYLHGPEQAVWFDRLEQERDNLRAAFHWLLEREGDSERNEMALRLGGALYWFWFVRGPVSEGWTVLSRALARSEGVAVAVRAKTLWAAGWLVGLSGDPERAETLCKESLVLYQEIGDKAGVAMASLILGIAALWKSQLAVGRSRFEESLELFRELGNTGAVEIVLPYLAQALFFQGDSAKAQVVLEEGLAISKQIGHQGWEGLMLSLLGQVFLQQDNIALARSGLEESLALSRELGLQDVTASTLCVLARKEAGQGNHATARALYEESLALSRDGGNYKWEIASFLEGLAAVVVPEGKPAWAARLWGAAEALRETSGAPLPATYHADYEQAIAAARVLLGEQAFATAWVEGRGMTVDQVLVAREAVTMPVAASPVHVAASPAGKSAPTYPDGLTAREVVVLRLVSQGLTDAQIAEQLIISPRTVNTHLTAIYGKIQVSSRSAATRYALEHHLT
jgi:DNA-binding CsgD family transcriptional regulator/tetratricopeptide (TPR) repeat protein